MVLNEFQTEETNPLEGTLAIDLGNSTTVVAFQGEKELNPRLVDLSQINRAQGEVPSAVWSPDNNFYGCKVGQEALNQINANEDVCLDFKRWIGSDVPPHFSSKLLPEKAGEFLIHKIWEKIPKNLKIKRLVLTAPVETYRNYREWLYQICNQLSVDEIALVDEPTAAALGAGLPAGSRLLVVDMGGSTTDLSIVQIEGGEGKAEPIAELMRFDGKDLENTTKQKLRCAKVLGKAGKRIGGRDIDRWILNHLKPDTQMKESLLNTAENLKCRLSNVHIKSTEIISEFHKDTTLKLCRKEFEELLLEKDFFTAIAELLDQTLQSAEINKCRIDDLRAVVLVGGGARIPIINKWLRQRIQPVPLLTPPPVEAVAKGALKLTPGVAIKDLLIRGISLRCWEKKSNKYIWHPLFLSGQPWPSNNPLEIILTASCNNQSEIDLVFGEPNIGGIHEVIYEEGIPVIIKGSEKIEVKKIENIENSIKLNSPGNPGEDCVKLFFHINNMCGLEMNGIDLRDGTIFEKKELIKVR
tara:strand:- start:43 stop:1620 length:1578 start_codon:yes stop_codon:yes gene_type:complete